MSTIPNYPFKTLIILPNKCPAISSLVSALKKRFIFLPGVMPLEWKVRTRYLIKHIPEPFCTGVPL